VNDRQPDPRLHRPRVRALLAALTPALALTLALARPGAAAAQDAAAPPASATAPTPAATPVDGTFAPEAWVAADEGVPVRSDPGFLYREITHLRAGQEVLVDERRGQWLHVRPEGWVFADHVRRRADIPATRRIRVLKEGSRVRQGPATDRPVVDTLSAGTELTIQDELPQWWVLGPDRYLFKELADEVVAGSGGGGGGPKGAPSQDRGASEQRRWTLMDLNGAVFEVAEFAADGEFVPALKREMRQTGLLEDDWTFMRLAIYVPEGPFRFNYSPEHNTVVITDVRGERYGNVFTRGPVERLPAHLRQFFTEATVAPGARYEGVLLFRPTLQTGAIDKVEMFLGGRLQRLYDSPATSGGP